MDSMIEIRPGRHIKLSVYPNKPERPTLFFIHGLGGSGAQWREQVKILQADYTLVVPDLLGQGDSEKPRSSHTNLYSFAELSLDLQAIFDRYASPHNILLGHSYGGAFASALALQNKGAIKKLVLISPVSCQPFKHVPLIYFLPVSLLEKMRRYLDRSFEKLAFAREDNAILLAMEREARLRNAMHVIKSLLMGMSEIPALDPRGLTFPTLILGGEEDRVIPNKGVRQFYGALPQQKTFVLKKAAHLVHLEQSQAVNEILANFLG